jgi:hypothetical protein
MFILCLFISRSTGRHILPEKMSKKKSQFVDEDKSSASILHASTISLSRTI